MRAGDAIAADRARRGRPSRRGGRAGSRSRDPVPQRPFDHGVDAEGREARA